MPLTKKRCLGIVSVAFIFLVIIIALEVMARAYATLCGTEKYNIYYDLDNILNWEPVPHQSATLKSSVLCMASDNEFTVTTNNYGFRDADYNPSVKNGIRIISMGDSETFGFGVNNNETYSHILENLLQGEGHVVEVMNLGVSGYDTLREYKQFNKYNKMFKPDIMLLLVDDNDWGPPFTLDKLFPGEYKLYRSAFLLYAKQLFYRLIGEPGGDWIQSIRILGEMKKEIKLPTIILLLYPIDQRAFQIVMEWVDQGDQVYLVDCRNELDKVRHHFARDGHINQEGHRIVAEKLAEQIRKNLIDFRMDGHVGGRR